MAERLTDPSGEPVGPVLRERRLSDKVAEMIRQTILGQQLPPGTPLPSERQLGEQFGVSRTVIREAVRALAAKGIVDVRSGSGLRVASMDNSTALESLSWFIRGGQLEYEKVHEVRSTIEVEMAGLAAQRRTEKQLQALQACHAHFESVANDIAQATVTDIEFHDLIAHATQNDLFTVLLGSIGDALIEIRRETLADGSGQETIDAHARILDCIAARDREGARAAMRDHLETVETLWEKRNSTDGAHQAAP